MNSVLELEPTRHPQARSAERRPSGLARGPGSADAIQRGLPVAAMLLPGALTVYLGFNAGGFFPDTTGIVAGGIALLLALRVLTIEAPFEGLRSPWLRVCVVGLGLFTAWTLVSAAWSDAPARALLEYDRALLYVLLLVLLGSFPGSRSNARWLIRGLAAGAVIVCVAGLVTRLLPGVWDTRPNIHPERLSFPITYWNTLGLLAAGGILLCVRLTTSEREPLAVRAVAAGAVPPLVATLLLTFSRGAIAVALLSLLVFILAGRPRLLGQGLLSTVPPGVVAAAVTLGADDVVNRVGSPAAVAQGKDVALAVAACAAAAAALRAVLGIVDRSQLTQPPLSIARPVRLGLAAGLVTCVVGMAAVLNAPGALSKQYHRFVNSDPVDTVDASHAGGPRQRLTNPGNRYRLEVWRAARHEFARHPLQGRGAGTYALTWLRARPGESNAQDAHSLYMEALSELGVVGFGLLVTAIGGALVGLAIRIRGPSRALRAALFAVAVAWAVRAGVDWDWEMPVVTVWMMAVAGVGLAARPRPASARPDLGRYSRIGVALAVLLVGITPVVVAVSQMRLGSAVAALERGECGQAIHSALGSIAAINARPEPFEVLGYCDSRLGRGRLAERAFRAAISRDPSNWETHYGLGLARAAAGRNPASPVRMARRLNPRGSLPRRAAASLLGSGRRGWRAYARHAPAALPP